MRDNKWVRLLTYRRGQSAFSKKYVIAENHLLRSHLPSRLRLRLSVPERLTSRRLASELAEKICN